MLKRYARCSPWWHLFGQVIVSQNPAGIAIKPQGGEAGTILVGNLPACNAVIHIVDRVLLPNLVCRSAHS